MTAIKKAAEAAGGQTALARILGTSQSHVWNWINREYRAPAKHIQAISEATGGTVSVFELLSDHENINSTD
ncbi:YdaS family helix-turn-helix protein [Vibrio sp. St2]|uniref:YdaS family helix-turn-helix protein n=1 Tax=Vibrio sp. St2 TaxID=2853441 RepID=UPI00248F468C|nr:YdaS family helix-turn-helix protein [Vibrio sp. St2]